MAFRTQKISQMTPKGANLEATDLIEVSTIESGSYVTRSITGQEIIDGIPPAAAAWGSITGTLSSQTDLQSALNAKQDTLTLTTTGTSGAATLVGSTLNIPQYSGGASGITIGTTAITSGTVGRILFEGTGNVVQESGNLFWDNTNSRLGIGTSSPSVDLHINKATATDAFRISQSGIANFYVSADGFATTRWLDVINYLSINSIRTRNNAVGIDFANASGTSIGRFAPTTFNLLINTTTDAGFRLDVNGTARVQGELTVNTVNIGLGGGSQSNNTRVGLSALANNTTGNSNSCFGRQAGQFLTTGGGNSFFGFVAGVATSTGSNNSFFGPFTGYDNTGSSNSYYGAAAGQSLTTGSNNIAFGKDAARYVSGGAAMTLLNNSILIGNDTRAAANNETNQIVIGHNAIGAGSNTVTIGNTSIVKTILRGTLNAANLPTSSAGLSAGDIWNDAGTLKIV